MKLPKLVQTEVGAIVFITQLHAQNRLFHIDESPYDIVDKAGNRVFTDEEAASLQLLLARVFDLLADPFETCLTLIDPQDTLDIS